MCGIRAECCAVAAVCAFVLVEAQFTAAFESFWVVAPQAAQRTTLEKYGCAYARAVVDGEMLYVKYRCFHTVHL